MIVSTFLELPKQEILQVDPKQFFFNRWQPKSFPSRLLCRVSFWLFTLFAIADIRYNCRQKWQAGRYKQNQPLKSNQASSWNIQTLLNLLFDKDWWCECIVLVTQTCLSKLETRAEDFHAVNFLWITLTALRITPLHCTIPLFFLEHPWHGVSCLFAMNPMNGWVGGCA